MAIRSSAVLCAGLFLNLSGCYGLLVEPYIPKPTSATPQPTQAQPSAPTQEKPTAEEQFETNTDLVAIPAFGGRWMSAPLGMSLKDLGRPYTASFQRIQGPGGATLFPQAEAPTPTKQNLMKSETLTIEDEQMLYAQASAWGFVSADLTTNSGSRYAVYRAMIISDVYEVDDTTLMRKASKDAVYYPARIYMGHVYEVVVSGSSSGFDTGIAAELGVYSGEIDSFAYRNKLTVKASGRGLRPSTSKAIFARTDQEIEQSYSAAQEDAVPILVEWRVIPGREEPSKRIAWTSLKKNCAGEIGCEPCNRWSFSAIEYDAPDLKLDGNAWDVGGGAPDIALSIETSRGTRTTPEQSDTYYASWQLVTPIEIETDDYVLINSTDIDFSAHDPMEQITGVLPSRLPGGVWVLNAGSLKLYGSCQHR